MNNERIEFALKILTWEVDAARKRLERRKKKLRENGEIAPHLLNMENSFKAFTSGINSVKRQVRYMQIIELKERKNIEWRRGKDSRNVAGRNQMILAYGRKRSS